MELETFLKPPHVLDFDAVFIPGVLNLNKCITIDRAPNPPDNGALACDRVAYPQHRDNSTNAEAIGNLTQSTPNQTTAKIVGHGAAGVLATGGGQSPTYNHDVIWLYGDQLEALFAPIVGRFSVIELEGCDVGAEQEGALLVWRIATIAKCIVMGPTGLVSCGGGVVTLQAGATWQVANSSMTAPPPVIHAPTSFFAFDNGGISIVLKLLHKGEVVEVSPESAQTVNVEFFGARPARARPLDHFSSRDLVPLLGLNRPVRSRSSLAALLTATISIEFVLKDDRGTIVKTFKVYNDRVLQDSEEPDLWYFPHASLKAVLNGMRQL